MFIVTFFIFVFIGPNFVRTETFISTTHFTDLLNTEISLAQNLETHLKDEYDRLDQIEKFLNVIKDEIRQTHGNEENYFSNPINAYLFIKHLTVEWNKIERVLPKGFSKKVQKKFPFPTVEDYHGSALGLMRLQDTYRLSPSQLANGKISSKFKSKILTASECFDLGRVAYTNGDFYHTLMWMQEALVHLDEESTNTTMNKIDILDHLAFATSQQGNVEHALEITEQILSLVPDHYRAKNNQVYYKTLLQNRTRTQHRLSIGNNGGKTYEIVNQRPDEEDIDDSEERNSYEELCRQNNSQFDSRRQAKLSCRYRHNNHPYLILRPVKEEQLSDRPAIFLFHDVINEREIQQIKALALPRLQRAVVRDSKTNAFKPAEYRISKSAWLRNEDSQVVTRLSKLIEAVTNLSMNTAEDLQIANYGIGGHYEPHFDFARSKLKDPFNGLGSGNRIATWLTYMSDVEQGGATVFPLVGAYLKPKKGAAAFWYNLLESGEGDLLTRHAACPVLIGNKWVANKWIHEGGQEFRRPCGLTPDT